MISARRTGNLRALSLHGFKPGHIFSVMIYDDATEACRRGAVSQ